MVEDLKPTENHSTASDDCCIDSNCSTPYVSAPSSPGHPSAVGGGFYFSAPASPMHFALSASSTAFHSSPPSPSDGTLGSFEFEFSSRFRDPTGDYSSPDIGYMCSADELFLNGQIRPMKLSSHLQRPQLLAPLPDVAHSEDANDGGPKEPQDQEEEDDRRRGLFFRSRELRSLRDRSLRRRARSLSPMRCTAQLHWSDREPKDHEEMGTVNKSLADTDANVAGGAEAASAAAAGSASNGTTPSASASSSRCSSAGRSSKRWVFLKDFLRSKSEGRNNVKFWTNISFSPAKEKKPSTEDSKEKLTTVRAMEGQKLKKKGKEPVKGSPTNGVWKRRVPPSAHELHYTANRAQAEEMRKKTFLPYRQGLLGCLGFSSRSYGALNGFARALNPVSSR